MPSRQSSTLSDVPIRLDVSAQRNRMSSLLQEERPRLRDGITDSMRAVLCWLQVEVCNSRMGQVHTYTGPAYANGTIVLTAQHAGSECLPEEAVEAPCVTGCALNVSYAVLGCARAIPCTRPDQYTPGQDPRALSRCTALATPNLVHAPASHDSSAGTYPGVQAQQMLSTCLEASQTSCCLSEGTQVPPSACA